MRSGTVAEKQREDTEMAKQKRLNYLVDGVVVHTEFLKEGEKIRIIKAPEKPGYEFKEWKDHPVFMPKTHLNIEAVYVRGSYRLTYTIDGVEVDHAMVTYGDEITPLPSPEREGLTFSGWQGLPHVMPAHPLTVNGTFAANTFTLTLLMNGETYAVYQFEPGADLSGLPNPELEGYTFSGWGKRYKKMPESNLTMKGTFKPNKHKVVFNVDDEYRFEKTVTFGEPIRAIAEPGREHYTFTGWGTIPETMPDFDLTFNGYFNINCYPITFSLDGEEIFSDEFDYGTPITPPEVPVKEGYVFSGWRNLPKTMPDEEVHAEGRYYLRRYRVICEASGKEVDRVQVLYGAAPVLPDAPAKRGYRFDGWEGVPETMPAQDVTVTARYIKV